MGILLSIIRFLTDNEENEKPKNPLFLGDKNEILEPSHRWQNRNFLADHSDSVKHLTISVPNSRFSSSSSSSAFADTSVNDEVKSLDVFIEENTSQNVCSDESKRIGMGPSSSVGKGEEIDKVLIKCSVVAPQGIRWITHYSNCHRILLVGEGDFSFSTCLARAFGRAPNMIATSLNSEDFLLKNYENALPNIVELGIRKCKVMHEIDATKIADHKFLGGIKFDRIVFNFPFAGFFKNLSSDSKLRRHRRLVSMFMKNAKEMLSENGEIHVTHKTNGVHLEWKLESMASSHGLVLIDAVDFKLHHYPGYDTKRGFGGDGNFNCYPSKTYKFGLKS